jgi:adenine-specific DNA-methyltransferase
MKTQQTLLTERITANSEQLTVLKNNFPQCFGRQGKFIVSKYRKFYKLMQSMLVVKVIVKLLGKSYVHVLANQNDAI